jgi:mannose-6-phosphate isomerase-like protein (cupin superfamily)
MSPFDKMLDAFGIGVQHKFAGGTYAKELKIPKGSFITQHAHSYDHLSILAVGEVEVEFESGKEVLKAPYCLTVPAGHSHQITAITDAVWYCIHATEVTDPEAIDTSIIERK